MGLKLLKPRLLPPTTKGWAPDAVRGNRHQRDYGYEWEKKRARILKRDEGLCQPCLRMDRVTVATQVDHIIQRASGGSEEDSNLQSICLSCHKEKTARESTGGQS